MSVAREELVNIGICLCHGGTTPQGQVQASKVLLAVQSALVNKDLAVMRTFHMRSNHTATIQNAISNYSS